MKLYSTKNRSNIVDLKEAVMKGLPDDNGLFMPTDLPTLSADFINNLADFSFQEIGFEVCKALFDGAIPDEAIQNIIQKALTFPAPVVSLDKQKHILELFHGPSLAFKDFGARFMAQLMGYFNQKEEKDLVILVATSGDTGGAVASGFYQTPGIEVVILYPSGKVSFLQEKQLTTLGHNITALEVNGTFDDCQSLVKKAFLDPDLNNSIRLSSANSINIARLIPQSFYYFEAYKQMNEGNDPVVFCVPSGNFGNLTAGLLAQKMGLPIHHFIAATNSNDVVPAYLESGKYIPRQSERTLSNAMDVGNPSNFARMVDLYNAVATVGAPEKRAWTDMKDAITGYAFNDASTEKAVLEVQEKYGYTIDPHGAVGYLALKEYQKTHPNTRGILLETAHPSKFLEDMERILGQSITVPERLSSLSTKEKVAVPSPNNYSFFKEWLLENY